MKKTFAVNVIAVIVLCSLAVFSLLALSGKFHSIPVAVQPASNGISVCLGRTPSTLDPAKMDSPDSATCVMQLFEGLMKLNQNGEAVSGMAKTFTVDETGTVYVFKLRTAIWSNGKNVTAGDFVYSWQRCVDPSNKNIYAYQLKYIKNASDILAGKLAPKELGVKALDEKTLQVELESRCGFFNEILALPALLPVCPDAVEAHPDTWSTNPQTCVTNGPYVLKGFDSKSHILMDQSTSYYDFWHPCPGYLDFKIFNSKDEAFDAFKAGTLDFLDTIPKGRLPEAAVSPEYHSVSELGTYFLCFNLKRHPFNNPAVRKALSLAVDREAICDEFFDGMQEAAGAFVPPGTPDAIPGSDFREVGGNYYNTKTYRENVSQAKRLLAGAGFPEGKGFPDVEILVNSDDEKHVLIAKAIGRMWLDELGIRSVIAEHTWQSYLALRDDGEFSVARHGWMGDFVSPVSFLEMWTTDSADNVSGFSNSRYDSLLTEAKNSISRYGRTKALHEAEDILVGEQSVVIPVYYYMHGYMQSARLSGVYVSPLGYKLFYLGKT